MNSSPRSTRASLPPEIQPLPEVGALWDGAPCGLLLTARDGTIQRANQTFCRWLGVAPEALVGIRRFQDLLTMGGRIFHQTHWAPLLQLQGSIAEVKLDVLHADGHVLPMVMNAVRREHGGVVFHEVAVFVAEDRHAYERELLRARRQAEELLAQQLEARQALALADARLRMALETAQLHVWEVDPVTRVRRYDDSVALLLGMQGPQPVDMALYTSALEPAELERATAAFSRVLDATSDVYRCTYRLHGVDGVERMVQATARAVVGEDGGVRHVVGLLQDITELARQQAEAEDRALFAEQMVGIVSHDLRNPLSTISLGAQVLELGGLAGAQQRVHGNITRAAARAQRLVDDLLDFTMARIGRGLSVAIRPVDLHALVAAQVEELALAHPERVLRHVRAGTGACLADGDRLFQLLGNLVANAMAYGAADTAVTVTSSITEEGFTLGVHNQGLPIPDALLATVFQPMVRGAQGAGGTRSVGLGLYIVSEIARAHGGQVGVASSADAGTTFTAWFPRTP